MTFYFTPNRLAVITEDPASPVTRGVVDLEANIEYSFGEIVGSKSFITNDFDKDISKPVPISAEYGEGRQLDEKIYGLTCKEYKSTDKGYSLTIITSEDIVIPDSTMLNSMLTDGGFTVSTEITDANVGFSYKVGLVSFSPKITDRSVLSIDTTGMNNMTHISEEFMNAIKEEKN